MQPEKPVVTTGKINKISRQRHFLAVFFISFMWGTFGVDRMYLGKVWTGIIKLVTFGGAGIWTIVDLILIMGGTMRDKQGREMLQFVEYKKFAYWTVLIFALVVGVIVLINGIALILVVNQLFTMFLNGDTGGLDSILQGIPGAGGSQIPSELQEYL